MDITIIHVFATTKCIGLCLLEPHLLPLDKQPRDEKKAGAQTNQLPVWLDREQYELYREGEDINDPSKAEHPKVEAAYEIPAILLFTENDPGEKLTLKCRYLDAKFDILVGDPGETNTDSEIGDLKRRMDKIEVEVSSISGEISRINVVLDQLGGRTDEDAQFLDAIGKKLQASKQQVSDSLEEGIALAQLVSKLWRENLQEVDNALSNKRIKRNTLARLERLRALIGARITNLSNWLKHPEAPLVKVRLENLKPDSKASFDKAMALIGYQEKTTK